MILRIHLQLNTRLQPQAPVRTITFSSIRLRHPLRHLLAAATGQRRDSNHPRVELSSSRIVYRQMRKHLPHSPCCLQMFWVLLSGSSRCRKPLSRFSNACNLVNRCITYLFSSFVYAKTEDEAIPYSMSCCNAGHFVSLFGLMYLILHQPEPRKNELALRVGPHRHTHTDRVFPVTRP